MRVRPPLLRWLPHHRVSLLLLILPLVCPAASPPNIVVIMADDLGWMDLHCQGNAKLDTPALDRLAAEGMRFTDAYAAPPVCSPTRADMMTGQSPARLRLTNHAPGHPDGFALEGSPLREAETIRHLPLKAATIAERLSAAGYTTAHLGKWHLSYVSGPSKDGITEPELRPESQGFSLNLGGCHLGGPPSYFSFYRNPALTDVSPGEYLPERLADEAIQFIRAHRDGPFFLNWWPYSVHYPMQAREKLIEKYRQRGGLKDPVYAAMIEGMDTAIGRFLKTLDEAGLRGVKGMLYEGGIRVPWVVRWPGKVQPGTVNSTPIISTECYPTLLEVAGLPPTPDHPLDGRSLVPLFTESPGFGRDSLYFHYPNYALHKQNRLGSAILEGTYKLINYYDDDSLELYDLSDDIGEKNDLAAESPELAARLANKLEHWLRQSDARLPVDVTNK